MCKNAFGGSFAPKYFATLLYFVTKYGIIKFNIYYL